MDEVQLNKEYFVKNKIKIIEDFASFFWLFDKEILQDYWNL